MYLFFFDVCVNDVPVNVENPARGRSQRPARRPVAHLRARDETKVDPVGDSDGAVSPV